MTNLELANALVELADISNTPLATLQSQTGVNLRVKNWIKQAWVDIQNLRPEWQFMRKDLSFVTASSQSYTLAAMGVGTSDTHPLKKLDNDSLRLYTTATGVADEQFLSFQDWPTFRDTFLYQTRQSGRPTIFSVDPADKSLVLAFNPGTGYTVTGYYNRTAVVLSADDDEPACPSDFHMAIVYRALLKYAGFEAAAEAKQEAKENYGPLIAALSADQLPEMMLAGALV